MVIVEGLCNLTSVPDEEVTAGVPREDVPSVEKGQGGDVLGLFPGLEDTQPLGQHAVLVQPEGDVTLAAGDDGVAVNG